MTGAMRLPVQFLVVDHETCLPADASGIFFRNTEFKSKSKCLAAMQLRFEPALQRSRKRRPGALEASKLAGASAV
jgi:hypothetical protein